MTKLVIFDTQTKEARRYVKNKTKPGWIDPLVRTHSGYLQPGFGPANALRIFLRAPPESMRDAPEPEAYRKGQVV